jgi:hypothetical protein
MERGGGQCLLQGPASGCMGAAAVYVAQTLRLLDQIIANNQVLQLSCAKQTVIQKQRRTAACVGA